jgi:hypothetical protein
MINFESNAKNQTKNESNANKGLILALWRVVNHRFEVGEMTE